MSKTHHQTLSSRIKQFRWLILAVAAALCLGGYFLLPGGKAQNVGATFAARRGPLDIMVLDGGSIESEEKGEVKCEVKGGQGVKILKIVEEGYQVTDEDVKTNKVLVELDSADLKQKIAQQEITFGSTDASLIDAQQAYDIQLNQNLSDVKGAEQKATFARMDFDKYLGDRAADEILARLGLNLDFAGSASPSTNQVPSLAPENTATNQTKAIPGGVGAIGIPIAANVMAVAVVPNAKSASVRVEIPDTRATNPPPAAAESIGTVDFSKYADLDLLGDGEAKQKLREAQDAVQIAQKELQQAQSTLEGTKRLFEKDFVTKIELEKDQLAYDNSLLKVKKASTALNLFSKYEFRKAAQEALSKYTESLRELDRTRKGAISKLAQADAKLKSAQAKYAVEEKQLKEFKEQLDKCVIKAPRPGLVVYGSGGEVRYWRDEEQIREGATVRQGQTVLTIPDLRKMCIKVGIHESYIKRIKKGQRVRITADSFPDRKVEGEVSQVGVLPDSENSWLNPDMKVYRTTVTIKGENDWMRPGMSAKVQIIVNQLSDVVYVPLQAIIPLEDKKVCFVLANDKLEQRTIEPGEFNDEFIEIKKGIKENEIVCLRAPAGIEDKSGSKGEKKKEPPKSEPKLSSTASPVKR